MVNDFALIFIMTEAGPAKATQVVPITVYRIAFEHLRLGKGTARFNASTYLIYRLATPGAVRLKIYNTLGQPVRTLVDQYQPAGFYQVPWDGRDQRGAAVAAGVYLTRLFYPGGEQTRRMLLLK